MSRPRLNVLALKHEYNDALRNLNLNNLFVAQATDGLLLIFEKEDNNINSIMINPRTYKINGLSTFKLSLDQFHDMFDEALNNSDYEYFGVETQGFKMNEVAESLTEALICMKQGSQYGNYRIRKLD